MSALGPESDRYRRLRLLGEGGAGQVWLVEDRHQPGSRLALKQSLKDEDAVSEALRREFAVLARLHHPGLVEPRELDRASLSGAPRMILEHVDGPDLVRAVEREGPALCLELAAEALRVLAFLHDFGLIHRDLKPANLLVRPRGRLGYRLVLLDLGLAVGQAPAEQAVAGPAGTLPYLAPELFEGGGPSPRSDLYGLGALLYEAAHGRPPFDPAGKDLVDFVEAVREGRRSRPALSAAYPEGFAGWLEELLSPDPAHRPADAREALGRLNAAAGTEFATETPVERAARLASDPPAGRDGEFGRIWSLLDTEGGPRVVWLTGPAGGGKSRMLRWLHTEAILRGWEVHAPIAGMPAGSALRGTGASMDDLQRLREQATRRPTLLLLDEMEATESEAFRLVERVAREGKAPPLRVVAALRPGEVGHAPLRRLLDDTPTVPTLHRVDLGPLDGEAVRAIAERASASRALSSARVEWLRQASEGSPLILEGLLVEGVRDGRKTEVLERSAAARLRLLTASARAWLEALAVIGRNAPETALAELSGLDEAEAREAAEEVRTAGLARPETRIGGRWSPDSRSVTEVVLRGCTPRRRRSLFRTAAGLFTTSEAPVEADPWRLARLWSGAGEPERGVDLAVQAARRSLERGAPDRAAQQLAYALRRAARRGPARLELRKLQAEALTAAGLYAPAARALGAALRLTRDRSERAGLLSRQAHALVHAGRFERAREAALEAMALSGSELPLERTRALMADGIALGRLGREAEALELFGEALGLARAAGEHELEAEALQNQATCKARLQRPDAEEDYHAVVELFRQLGRPDSELKSLIGLSAIHLRAGRLEQAEALLGEVRDRSTELGQMDLLETALSKLAFLATERGQLDRALNLGYEALDQARHLGDHNRMMVDRCRLAEALTGSGRPAEAVELLREALKRPAEQIEPEMLDSARMLLAHALLEVPGSDDESIRVLLGRSLDGFRRRRKPRPLLMALAIEMERRAAPGAQEPFEPVHREFEAIAASSGLDPDPEIRIRAELAHGAWLLRRGNAAGARDEARSAARIAEHARLAADEARARGLLAQALEQLGETDAAAAALARGAELLEDAARCISDPATRDHFVERRVFRDLRRRRPSSAGHERRLLALYEMIRALNSESDPELLLEAILEMAIRAVPAERGMILLRDPGPAEAFSVHVSRNLEEETEADALEFSRSIVNQAGAGESILALDAGEDSRFCDLKSVSLYGIRSLMCVPLRSRGTVVGTVYLDSRKSGSLFSRDDLRFVEAFADHAALALQNAQERAALVAENRRLRDVAETRVRFGEIVGRSDAMQRVFDLIEKVAASDLPVLIEGESGTGKELVARAVHFHGPRRNRIFLSENCAAIPETLLESELFGHVKGAFTGADRERRGLFEEAHGGSLFLDEVGDMSPAMQARLLRVVQDGELRRVGGARPIRVDVRVIAATHRNLQQEVEQGRFREDLLYRLQVLPVCLPPLRERPDDIGPLIDHFLERIARERGRPPARVEPEVRGLLERYAWPGNVRQLENALQRLVLLAGDGPIGTSLLEADVSLRQTLLGEVAMETPTFSLDDAAREQLRRALRAAGGNRERAARLMGVSRVSIYRKIKALGLRSDA